ncbi:cell cycle control protein (Cwf26) [Apiospora saccharicola]|uniref:Cell cycle control protein (Cwf26) n=1 Tax=Apiospora saccharicola TaxID=335842 RepID=A0ABR1UPG9_9PEZI
MPSDLSSYLATRYLTADPKPSSKKRKRKQDPNAGLIIADDEETGWSRTAQGDDDDDGEGGGGGPATVAGTSAEFRKAKKSGWKVLGAPIPSASEQKQNNADAAAADAILASAAQESAETGGGENGDDGNAPAVVTMSDGTHAGLQSAAAVSAQLEKRRRMEREAYERDNPHAKEAETVYRDATGRRVDVSMKRAEARRLAAEAAAKEQAKKDALRGEVQQEEARRRRDELDDVRIKGVARHADDEDMNAELKAQSRWGDTMADFVGKSDGGGGGSGAMVKAGDSKKIKDRRPLYQGAAPPNRYGIKPGYRWDGVDRGNGFETERFKAINRVTRNKDLDYNWQMDE